MFHLVLKDGRSVGSLLRDGKGLLLDFDPGASHQAFACRQSKKISYAATDARDQLGLQTVLVRPDGIIAWASETAPMRRP